MSAETLMSRRGSGQKGFTPCRASAQQGFTLVELLITLLIFGMLSAAGVALLSFSVRSQEMAGARLADMAALRRAGALITSDLAQAVVRTTRSETGSVRPAFVGGSGGEGALSLSFVRRGWENADGAPRSSLQKVEYGLVEDRLERRVYRYVDGAGPQPPAVLIEGVASLRLRYRDNDGEWRDRWDAREQAATPMAVEMLFDMGEAGTVRQVFLTGSKS